MIFWDDAWVPICGNGFWNNSVGSTLFCQKLGYESGTIDRKDERQEERQEEHQDERQDKRRQDKRQDERHDERQDEQYAAFDEDTFWVGKCDENDSWTRCSGGCNLNRLGGDCDNENSCTQGKARRMHLSCIGGNRPRSFTCTREYRYKQTF